MRSRSQSGMTLLEVLIAIAILGLMMSMVWRTISRTIETTEEFSLQQQRNQELRLAMAVITRDLAGAFLSSSQKIGNTQQRNQRTIFVGTTERPVDNLRFSTFSHDVMWGDVDETDQTMVFYTSAKDQGQRNKTNLVRTTLVRLSEENWETEPSRSEVLVRDIEEVTFRYWSWKDKEWKDRWNSHDDSDRNRLPTKVQVTISVPGPDGGDPIEFSTQAFLPLQERLAL